MAIPDEVLGNRLLAVPSPQVGAKLPREDLLTFCNKSLPPHMIPNVIEFRESLPKTSTGKTDRVALTESFVALGRTNVR